MSDEKIIKLAHGGGGSLTRELIASVFAKHFANVHIEAMGDSAIVDILRSRIAFTTDSYVVKPLFFPGGDIGKLAICGTVNDLAVAGARARYISCGFIIEEGLELEHLERVVMSMAATARECGALVVTGDTKVVERGSADGLFINTSGIGEMFVKSAIAPSKIQPGDKVLINGPIADHGMAIMCAREGLKFESEIKSDCAPLVSLAEHLCAEVPDIRFMRDATRGGLGAVICEATNGMNFGVELFEENIPLNESTEAACELLGIDPMFVANEGKLVAVVPASDTERALAAMQSHPLGKESSIIGEAKDEHPGHAWVRTIVGTRRQLTLPSGEQLPRIC